MNNISIAVLSINNSCYFAFNSYVIFRAFRCAHLKNNLVIKMKINEDFKIYDAHLFNLNRTEHF